jgi:Protein of unknown function (DUF2846)
MMSTARSLVVVLLAFGVFGCATTGPKFMELGSQLPSLDSDTGRIYIYRKTAFGAAIQPKVVVNGENVGYAVPKGFIFLDKKPGNYEIMTSTEVERKLSLTLEGGQTRFVRLNISLGFFVGHVYPELVENEVGEADIQNLHYIGDRFKPASSEK